VGTHLDRRAPSVRRALAIRPRRCLGLALALAALTACQRAESADASPNQFAIGVGAIAGRPGYQSVVRGMEMAVERLNETGGSRFRVRQPDRSMASAVQVAQSLRDDPTVIGVVGHPEGSVDRGHPVYADAGTPRRAVVAISPTASSPRSPASVLARAR
jgi:branched-chain amino acid transport system substrate-binding protein